MSERDFSQLHPALGHEDSLLVDVALFFRSLFTA